MMINVLYCVLMRLGFLFWFLILSLPKILNWTGLNWTEAKSVFIFIFTSTSQFPHLLDFFISKTHSEIVFNFQCPLRKDPKNFYQKCTCWNLKINDTASWSAPLKFRKHCQKDNNDVVLLSSIISVRNTLHSSKFKISF